MYDRARLRTDTARPSSSPVARASSIDSDKYPIALSTSSCMFAMAPRFDRIVARRIVLPSARAPSRASLYSAMARSRSPSLTATFPSEPRALFAPSSSPTLRESSSASSHHARGSELADAIREPRGAVERLRTDGRGGRSASCDEVLAVPARPPQFPPAEPVVVRGAHQFDRELHFRPLRRPRERRSE